MAEQRVKTNLDIVLDKAAIMRGWLELPSTKRFFEWLEAEKVSPERVLHDAVEPCDLYRAQGEVARINRIQGLPKQITDYLASQTDASKR